MDEVCVQYFGSKQETWSSEEYSSCIIGGVEERNMLQPLTYDLVHMEKQYQNVDVVLFPHVLKPIYEPAHMKILSFPLFMKSFLDFTMFKSGNSSGPNSDQSVFVARGREVEVVIQSQTTSPKEFIALKKSQAFRNVSF